MRSRLAVRINDGLVDRHIPPRKVSGLRFTKAAPGGFHSASMRIDLPRADFPNLGPNNPVYVYDERTGKTVWEGYTNNPGTTDGTSGQGFELTAIGTMVRASEQSEKLIYIDCSPEKWKRDNLLPQFPSSAAEVGIFPSDAGSRAGDPALFVQFTPGQPLNTGYQTGAIYDPFIGSSMTLGGFAGFYDAGKTDANYELQWVVAPSPATILNQISMSSTGASFDHFAPTDFASGFTNLVFRLVRIAGGATNVAAGDDNVWAAFGELVVLGHLMDRDGNLLDMSTWNVVLHSPVRASVPPNWVVEDLLGRILTFCDPLSAENDASSQEVTQLAYHDGATAAQVLEDLMLIDPGMYWGLGETMLNGGIRFWYRRWPEARLSTPATTGFRYALSTLDGYQATGGDDDLCNRIAVYWTDSEGAQQITVREADVPGLGGAPGDPGARIRDAESITLPEGRGSLENAQMIGDAILAAKADPPKSGSAVVGRKVLDYDTGNVVMPWELEPGYCVLIAETGDVLRLTEAEFSDDDCSTRLTLGEPVLTEDQRIARLSIKR